MWYCITGWLVPNVLTQCDDLVFKHRMCLLLLFSCTVFFSSLKNVWHIRTDGFMLVKIIMLSSTWLTSLICSYQQTDTLSHEGQIRDQVSSTVKIQQPHKATGLQKRTRLIGQLSTNWYLRSFNNCTGDRVAEDVMGHRTHVTILFHN
jgi:hypothetical protein